VTQRADGVFVHPDGRCESDDVGAGTRIWAFAHVLPGAVIGVDCNVCDHAYVEAGAVVGNGVTIKNGVQIWDGVSLEDHVFVGPNATFTNDILPRAFIKKDPSQFLPTVVRSGATIGANATVICGATVGQESFVAAGAVVVSDVPAHALMAGNPARRIAWACTCGRALPESLQCAACGKRFRLVDESAGLASAD